jgi:formamidopyrimidine-DNA glycosylase
LAFTLENGGTFVYADPRRFGFVEVVNKSQLGKRFASLGVEPLYEKTDFQALTGVFRKLKAPVKTALMNQKFIVGVGNIYAAEILFAAGVSPLRICSKITHKQYEKIWKELRKILNKAVFMGGSTIENYRNGFGEKGEFQSEFWVYGKAGDSCRRCREVIVSQVQAGRSSFWCPDCQK